MPAENRPNIVIINPDQMRWDYASCYGHPFINTKHLDALAGMGTRFERAFVSAPTCGPSRASFLTGRYPCEHGVRNYGGDLPPDYPSYLKTLKQAGYVRGLFGKDHVFRPDGVIGHNYDEGENICLGLMADHPAYVRAWDCAPLEETSEWNITKRLTDAGLEFIDRHASGEAPFFVTINYQDPHPFFTCPEPWASLFQADQFTLPPNYRTEPAEGEIRRLTHWRIHSGETDMPEPELRQAMAMYCGQIRYVDDQVGRIMQRLRERSLLENTIVLFWSDHGEFIGDFGVTHKLPAFFECLIRVPMVLWDPTGKVPRGVFPDMVEAMDIVATILDLCRVAQPRGSRARSLLKYPAPRQDVFAEAGLIVRQPAGPVPGLVLKGAQPPSSFGAGTMLRTERWKLCLYADDQGEMYDLLNDPHEAQNLYDDPASANVKTRLLTRLTRRLMGKGQAPEDLPSGM